jgi:hypothetical protein
MSMNNAIPAHLLSEELLEALSEAVEAEIQRRRAEKVRTLALGDGLAAHPCRVTVMSMDGDTAEAFCSSCLATHVLSRTAYEAGRGPWKPVEVTRRLNLGDRLSLEGCMGQVDQITDRYARLWCEPCMAHHTADREATLGKGFFAPTDDRYWTRVLWEEEDD